MKSAKPKESVGAPKGDGGLLELPLIWIHLNFVTHLLKEAKSAFLAEFIDLNADHQGKLFRAVKDLTMRINQCLQMTWGGTL